MALEARIPIIVAIITVAGSLGSAAIANWDKLFPSARIDSPPAGTDSPPVVPTPLETWSAPVPLVDIETLRAQVLGNLSDDELWGDLGDAYAVSGDARLAESSWAVALLLQPDDLEWANHSPDLSLAADVIRALWVTDDAWVRGLGDTAQNLGRLDAAQSLYRVSSGAPDPTDSAWQQQDLSARVLGSLSDDELWGDLGDGYAVSGDARLAESAWAVALLLQPGDPEWASHSPALSLAGDVIRALGITDDEWVGDLGDAAQHMGQTDAAQSLYRVALALDPADSEWLGKVTGSGF